MKNVAKNEAKTTKKGRQVSKRDSYYTSVHYAAAEVVLNHLRYLVAKRKLADQIHHLSTPNSSTIKYDENNEEEDGSISVLNDSRRTNMIDKGFVSDFNIDLSPQTAKRVSDDAINKTSYQKYNDATNARSRTHKNMAVNSTLLAKNTTIRELSIISESMESAEPSHRGTNKTSVINNTELDHLIQQELDRK